MSVICITAWKASDGKIFESYEAAQEHDFCCELNKIMDHVGRGGEWDAYMFAKWIIDNVYPLKQLLDNAPIKFRNNGMFVDKPLPGVIAAAQDRWVLDVETPPPSLKDTEIPF